jgi:hypothetical protein
LPFRAANVQVTRQKENAGAHAFPSKRESCPSKYPELGGMGIALANALLTLGGDG